VLVPPDDPPSLCRRLCELMADPSRGSQIGSAARAEAHSRYSFKRMIETFDRLYVRELTVRGVLSATQPQLAAS